MPDLLLSPTSRFKDTPLYLIDGQPMFGLFQLPDEVATVTTDDTTDRLADAEAPFLDIMAVRNYGPGSEGLWWMIAARAGIVDIDRDVIAGLSFSCPSRSAVEAFRSRPSSV